MCYPWFFLSFLTLSHQLNCLSEDVQIYVSSRSSERNVQWALKRHIPGLKGIVKSSILTGTVTVRGIN